MKNFVIKLVKTLRHPSKTIHTISKIGFNGAIRNSILYSRYQHEYKMYRQSKEQQEISTTVLLNHKPLISILVPTYNSDPVLLQTVINSVLNQTYQNWEICIADDASTSPHMQTILSDYASHNNRIKVTFRSKNGHISAASNTALGMASGEYVALLDHDDELHSNALFEVVKAINQNPTADFIYTDEDKITLAGEHIAPFFKPDWSPHLLLTCNYIAHFAVLKRTLIHEINGFRNDYVGSQDHDLFLRATEKAQNIIHISKILYSWRISPTSAASSIDAKPYAIKATQNAIRDTVKRRGLGNIVEVGSYYPFFRVRPPISEDIKISCIIPLKDEEFQSINKTLLQALHDTSYNTEIIISRSKSTQTHIEPESQNICNIYSDEKNYQGLLTAGAERASGQFLLFLEPEMRPRNETWLISLLELAIQPEIGCVGSKLLSYSNQIYHAGMAIRHDGTPYNIFEGLLDIRTGITNLNLKDTIYEVSGVSWQGMLIKRSNFGGFSKQYSEGYFDLDLGLNLIKQGLLNIYTPYSSFVIKQIPNYLETDKNNFIKTWSGIEEKYHKIPTHFWKAQ